MKQRKRLTPETPLLVFSAVFFHHLLSVWGKLQLSKACCVKPASLGPMGRFDGNVLVAQHLQVAWCHAML